MPPEEAFAVQMRFKLEVRRGMLAALSRRFVSAEVQGDRATVLLRERRGQVRMSMVLVDGRWLLEGF